MNLRLKALCLIAIAALWPIGLSTGAFTMPPKPECSDRPLKAYKSMRQCEQKQLWGMA
jgi:hypothetical protein